MKNLSYALYSIIKKTQFIPFVTYPVPVEKRNHRSETGLMIASAHGASDTVQVFIDNESDLEARDAEGKTAILHAAEKGYHEIVSILHDKSANIKAQTLQGETAFHLIALSGGLFS